MANLLTVIRNCVFHMFLFDFMFLIRNCESRKSLRIWKGRDALPNEFPYVVRIELQSLEEITWMLHYCTGSLIAPTWTLTAAHCANFRELPDYKPVLLYGAVSRGPRKNDTAVDITAWFMHPSYDDSDNFLFNDIALLKSEPIYLSKYGKVSAVHYKTLHGLEVKTVGYGVMSVVNGIELDTRETKKPLQVMTVILKKCEEPDPAKICLSQMCDSENVICGGDSGGPTVHWSGIVGVSSSSPLDCDNLDEHPNFDLVDMAGTIIAASNEAGIKQVLGGWRRNYRRDGMHQ